MGTTTQLNHTAIIAPALETSATSTCLRTNMQCTEQFQCCSGWCLTDMTDHGVVGLCQERLMGSVELVRGNITQLNNTVTLAPALGSSAMCLRTNMQCTEQSQCCSGWCLTDMTDHGVVGLCQERLMGSVGIVRGNITQLNNT